jgi:hypothetical protein
MLAFKRLNIFPSITSTYFPQKMRLHILHDMFTIHRLAPDAAVPEAVWRAPIFCAMRTREELSLVVPSDVSIESEKHETDWRGFQVAGELDFALVGILAKLSSILAEAGVPLFALSTFNTDYLLVKQAHFEKAKEAFLAAELEIG